MGTWNVRSLYRPGAFQSMVGEVERYGVEVVALQETRWAGEGSLNAGSYTLHYGGSEIHSFGVGFMINKKILSAGRWYKIAIINVHAPTEDKDDEIKNGFYEELEHLVDQLPNDYMKIVLEDFNAKIGKEDIFRPTIGLESLHEKSNDNGVRINGVTQTERLSINKTNGQMIGTKRLNVQSLTEGENGIKYAVEVTNRFAALKEIDESDDNAVDKQWENVRDAMVKAAEATVLQAAHNIFKNKKRQYLKRKIEEINENGQSGNVRGMYMGINNYRKGFQARTEMVKDENDNLITDSTGVLNTWKNHFDRLLNVEFENNREIESLEFHTT
ncbi:uncharacterized protein [Polyergus mexicanus]|uniref:uncharacterized protein n=1 Tax=Polyergus mexicanus TaxID=615972 RepID=UPI0038B437D7